MNISILGRETQLAIAELEAIYGSQAVRPLGSVAACVDAPIDIRQLGGQQKTGQLLGDFPAHIKLTSVIEQLLTDILPTMPSGKISLGVSVYGSSMSAKTLSASLLSIKKTYRSKGVSLRIIPNTQPELSTAQVIHNKLTGAKGIELLCIFTQTSLTVARTTQVQDIEDYTRRDRGRPKRDAFVGMLPPKLAQTMINLATGDAPTPLRILDPFCGTGVILQEALLRGHTAYGTDISQKMIDFSTQNLQWLSTLYDISSPWEVHQADATNAVWQPPIDAIVCETYLGRPIGGQSLTPQQIQPIVDECNQLMALFLEHCRTFLAADTPLCVAVPVWFVGNNPTHLSVVRQLARYGYREQSFTHVKNPLIYRRPDQPVGRQLLVLRTTSTSSPQK